MADIETSIRPGERAQTIRTETSTILRKAKTPKKNLTSRK
mgnify:CR=1 FL=1